MKVNNSTCSALKSSNGAFHKRFPPLYLADFYSESSLVKVLSCAQEANIDTKLIILSRNQTGGQITVTEAKDMLYEFMMSSLHHITLYRAHV